MEEWEPLMLGADCEGEASFSSATRTWKSLWSPNPSRRKSVIGMLVQNSLYKSDERWTTFFCELWSIRIFWTFSQQLCSAVVLHQLTSITEFNEHTWTIHMIPGTSSGTAGLIWMMFSHELLPELEVILIICEYVYSLVQPSARDNGSHMRDNLYVHIISTCIATCMLIRFGASPRIHRK